ncbi:hypothetical protein CBF34_02910 [Vagococcus penaei]|uniref:Uncharacterized protein n=1 Tax=Vagococcus penaei TaxID=633807 RepID=A0A1Q2D3T8_9ENTE|nr:DUF1189 domain-containing protein [Vagococcus penaei]AQP53060.1 hypothetical protein BW732_01675 [Vagococcus penaei]RSU06076.1 hypothetical protein CBF34_02910 [Vagococcus penaei]
MKTLFTTINKTIKSPVELLHYRNKKGFAAFGYLLLLTLILSIPMIVESISLGSIFQKDGELILNKLPDFSIKDGTLTTDKEDSGFVYQTNSIIFTFDPENKRSAHDVTEDGATGALAVGLLKNEVVVGLPTVGTASDMVENLTFPYKSMPLAPILNKSTVSAMLTNKSSMITFLVVMIITAFLLVLGNFVMNLLLLTIVANLSNKLRQTTLTFGQTFKLLIYCSTIPSILSVILQLLVPTDLPYSTFSVVLTVFIYFSMFPRLTKKS